MEEQDEIECQPLQDVANELESNNEQENETINACLECLLVTADNCWALSKKIAALISLGSICLVIMLTLGNGPEIEPTPASKAGGMYPGHAFCLHMEIAD